MDTKKHPPGLAIKEELPLIPSSRADTHLQNGGVC
jgi:hypothetical protein